METARSSTTRKLSELRALLERTGKDGFLINSVVNYAWLTGARGFVNIADGTSVGKILVTQDNVFLFTTDNESQRLLAEELGDLTVTLVDRPWYQNLTQGMILKAAGISSLAQDGDHEVGFARLRANLSPEELATMEALGAESAELLRGACQTIEPGMSERECAGLIASLAWGAGMEPLVMNIAADDRATRYRHPLPTDARVEKHAIISLCLRRRGLNVTLTRAIHFGPVPEALRRRHHAAARLEALAFSLSTPGARVGAIVASYLERYASEGFPEEWKRHPIGGLIGFKPREFDATEETDHVLAPGQAFCWNPTILGAKSEDTFIVTESGPRYVTSSKDFPTIDIAMNGTTIRRPDILVR